MLTVQQQQLFHGPLSRTNWVSRYQKKHSPTHHPDHHPIFISFFHLPRSIASSLFKLGAWQSFLRNLFPCPLWSTSWPGALHIIFHTFLHPISLFFSQERVASQIKTLATIAATQPLTLYNLPQRYDPSKRLQ